MTPMQDDDLDRLTQAIMRGNRRHEHRTAVLASPPGVLTVGQVGINTGACLLLGWSLAQLGANPFTASIFDGADTKGASVAAMNVALNMSTAYALPGPGLLCKSGLLVNVTSGTADGAIYYRRILDFD